MTTQPVLAATTILLRENPGPLHSTEVLLMRRPPEMRAFSKMWVFPGGKLDPADYAAAARDCVEDGDGKTENLPVLIAACREMFEEAGVLLARSRTGALIGDSQLDLLLQMRSQFIADPALFFLTLLEESILLDVHSLVPWERWITPPLAPRRFDTTFFATMLPAGQIVRPDASETSEARWMDLATFSADIDANELSLVPATLINLLDVQLTRSRHEGCAEMLTAERLRKIVSIEPKVTRVEGEPWAVLPWDPHYTSISGETSSMLEEIPEHLRCLPGRLSALATRRPMN